MPWHIIGMKTKAQAFFGSQRGCVSDLYTPRVVDIVVMNHELLNSLMHVSK